MSGEPRGRRQTAARTAGQPPGEAGRRGLLWGAHLIGVGDVPGVGQHEGAELVEILHGSLALLRGLQGTAPQGQTVPAHPVPAPAVPIKKTGSRLGLWPKETSASEVLIKASGVFLCLLFKCIGHIIIKQYLEFKC